MTSTPSFLGRLRASTPIMGELPLLLALLVLLKGLIPMGYMPDMAALQHQEFKITLCTAYGDQQIGQGNTTDQPSKSHMAMSDFCPFGWMPHAVAPSVINLWLPELFLAPQPMAAFIERFLTRLQHSLAAPRAPPAGI